MGVGEQFVVNLHSGEQIMPWLCAGNFLVLLQVSLSLLLYNLAKGDTKCFCHLSTTSISCF